ncbi:glypican-1b [Kryptolebias marmoratus]|uniref:Glypican-1 n=1 Tax=Kryptolebias marmoratus TaxID=37003 RepID=A0A3Q3BFL1_KRYMA|nr:glypican-1b [Kryptolebias marmoratus]
MDSFIIAALALCSLTAPACGDKGSSKARSCSNFRTFYKGKHFPLDGVPQSEISGEHLRICSQGYTCCTSVIEDNLASLSSRELEAVCKNTSRSLQVSLAGQRKAFDGYALELLNYSMSSLHETFISTWGSVYFESSQVFSDLYQDLTDYYKGSATNVNLEEVLNEFWTKLMEKLFYMANKQNSIGEDYLDCVSKQIETLRPFGDTPHKMTTQVTHTFVAARSFLQGLLISEDVVRKVSQVHLSKDCMRSIMKMTYCPHCHGMVFAQPCANYCSNVIKGCLANQADLNPEWTRLADSMIELAKSCLEDMDSVILSLPNRISEAMFTMMENIGSINNKVFLACGNLKKEGASRSGVVEILKNGRVTVEDRLGDSPNKMTKLLSNVTTRLKDMRSHWISLPRIFCSDREAQGAGAEDKCWNGISRARYLPEVIGDGLASQINNPEVDIDITKPDMLIRRQIMQLKIMTHHLKNALNGFDVDFQDTSDDVSGSGSGACVDEMCSRGPRLVIPISDRPTLYDYPPENEKVKGSSQQNLPCVIIHLLSLLILLLQR